MDLKTVYKYIDGNGNKFIIETESIEYIPVKPTYSSSGIYNGGDYIKKKINKIQFDEIISVIYEGVKNQEIHIKDRVKLSGMIIIVKGNSESKYILAPNTSEIMKIEKVLHDIINEYAFLK